MNYFDHNDSKGQSEREAIAAYTADRLRVLNAFQEKELGDITLFLPADAAQLRAREALILSGKLGV